MLFADDMVIFGNSPEDLQNSLNLLKSCCDNRGLSVNVDKSKVMVFRKRGGVRASESWTFKGQDIELVNDFNYL